MVSSMHTFAMNICTRLQVLIGISCEHIASHSGRRLVVIYAYFCSTVSAVHIGVSNNPKSAAIAEQQDLQQ